MVTVRCQVPFLDVPETRDIGPNPALWLVVALPAVITGALTPEGSLTFTDTVNVAGPSLRLKTFLSTDALMKVGGLVSAGAAAFSVRLAIVVKSEVPLPSESPRGYS